MDDIESQMLLAHVETWMVELEREVRAFEAAVEEVEEVMDDLEYAEERDDADGQTSPAQNLQQLERTLEATDRVAQLVHAADSALSEAIVTVYQTMESETSVQSMAGTRPATTMDDFGIIQNSAIRLHRDPDIPLQEGSLILGGRYRLVQLLHQRPRLNLYLAQRESVLESVGADLSCLGEDLKTVGNEAAPLLLRSQPTERNVSPIYRPSPDGSQFTAPPDSNSVGADLSCPSPIYRPSPDESQFIASTKQQEPLVAIRELVLTGLSPQVRKQIERAAFEEFVSPVVLGTARLPGAGDRVRVEGERNYLVMQLRRAKGERPAMAVTLAELLLSRRQWPAWLDLETALEWGLQLCRIVARLHRLGSVLGDLDASTVLVDSEGAARWAPVLLVSWPPPPQFWPASGTGLSAAERHARIFPAAHLSANKAFAAPEMLNGVCDQRSDVYSLGALLYLLLTRYAPPSAARRMRAAYRNAHAEHRNHHNGFVPQSGNEGMALIPPHLFNHRIPAVLEHILSRALALDPAERYSTVFELMEALESEEVRSALAEATAPANDARRASRVGNMVEWLKRELNE